jgi:hypothetical protein
MSEHTDTDEDTIRKLRAELRALTHQRAELQEELKAHRTFVRLCAAVFPAVDGLRPQHAMLYAAEKARPLATLPTAVILDRKEVGE